MIGFKKYLYPLYSFSNPWLLGLLNSKNLMKKKRLFKKKREELALFTQEIRVSLLKIIFKKKIEYKNSINIKIFSFPFFYSSTILLNHLENEVQVSVNDFIPLKVLGRGAFGKVMLVEQKGTGKIYAMKSLKKEELIDKE